jgi:hypothetical protein
MKNHWGPQIVNKLSTTGGPIPFPRSFPQAPESLFGGGATYSLQTDDFQTAKWSCPQFADRGTLGKLLHYLGRF